MYVASGKRKLMANEHFYKSREWRELRFSVLVEFGRKCMCCNATDKPLHVDHIKPISKYPHLKLTKANLQVLCEDCNLGKSNKYESDFRKTKTKLIKKSVTLEVTQAAQTEPRRSLEEISGKPGFIYTRFKLKKGRSKRWHLWDGKDTECKMFNELSQTKREFREFDESDKDKIICKICIKNRDIKARRREKRSAALLRRSVKELDEKLAAINYPPN